MYFLSPIKSAISVDVINYFFPERSDVILAQLRYFCELVYAKNEILNLISRKDIEHIVEAHLLPSRAIFKNSRFTKHSTGLDIGTGRAFVDSA
jgi:16S rRNA (guanine527-N7)-methyltransferase